MTSDIRPIGKASPSPIPGAFERAIANASFPSKQWRVGYFLPAFAMIGFATALAASSPEAPFLAENDAAMTKMMAAMTIKPSGDVDRDFVAMMAPHHQGAVDMAQAELRYGHNEKLRRIAQEIVVEQLQQIDAMHLALGDIAPSAVQSGATDRDHAPPMSGHPMSMHKEP
jgi:hypothetical protein